MNTAKNIIKKIQTAKNRECCEVHCDDCTINAFCANWGVARLDGDVEDVCEALNHVPKVTDRFWEIYMKL